MCDYALNSVDMSCNHGLNSSDMSCMCDRVLNSSDMSCTCDHALNSVDIAAARNAGSPLPGTFTMSYSLMKIFIHRKMVEK